MGNKKNWPMADLKTSILKTDKRVIIKHGGIGSVCLFVNQEQNHATVIIFVL